MGNNYKVHIDKKLPSVQDIDKHKDFGRVIQGVQDLHDVNKATKPLYRNPKLLSLVVTIMVILLLLILQKHEKHKKDAQLPGESKKNTTLPENNHKDDY